MTQAKVELFDQDLQIASSYFKALAHPARLAILKYLSESKTCISGDISNELPLSRTTVNQHLNELKSVGLIKGEILGVKTKYCLDKSKIAEMKSIANSFIASLDIYENQKC